MSKRLRVAVLLAGEMRTYDAAAVAAGFAAHVFGPYDCDVFLATWRHRGVSAASADGDCTAAAAPVDAAALRAFYLYLGASRVVSVDVDDLDAWKATLPPALAARYAEGYEWSGRRYPGSSVPQLFKLSQAFAALRGSSSSKGGYDVVLRARPDALFRAPAIPVPPHPNHVYAINCMHPHRSFWPQRIYDIYFYGSEAALETLVGTYRDHVVNEAHPFHNGLHPKDTCRLLYVQALRGGLNVVDIDYDVCMIYRG